MRGALAVVMLAGCASSPPQPAVPPPGVSDKCSAIPHGCPGTADDDGCPDVIFDVGPKCQIGPKVTEQLARAAQEILNEADLGKLRIVAPTMLCVNVVRAHLAQHGVPDARLGYRVEDNRSFVSFEVEVWKGETCK